MRDNGLEIYKTLDYSLTLGICYLISKISNKKNICLIELLNLKNLWYSYNLCHLFGTITYIYVEDEPFSKKTWSKKSPLTIGLKSTFQANWIHFLDYESKTLSGTPSRLRPSQRSTPDERGILCGLSYIIKIRNIFKIKIFG